MITDATTLESSTLEMTDEQLLALFGEGASEAPLFLTTKDYCGIPAGSFVELCALRQDFYGGAFRLGFRTVELLTAGGTVIEPTDYGDRYSDTNWGWFVPPTDVRALTPVAAEILAKAVA